MTDEMSQLARENHATLPEHVRFENALNIWVRDLRDEQLALVKKGGRLSVAALGYEEVLKLRGILGRFMVDRKRRVQGRWDRRRERRDGRGNCLSCWNDPGRQPLCTAGRHCVAAGRDDTPNPRLDLCWCGNADCALQSHK